MADIFSSPSKDSLFPMRVSLPSISKEEYHLFYKKDRTLLLVLHRDAVQSIPVMGFILWLERGGYTSKNLIVTILNSLNLRGIERLANHLVICLKLLDTKKPANFISADISGLQCFLDRNCLTLEEIYGNRDSIIQDLSCIANELSNKASDNILERFIRCGAPFSSYHINDGFHHLRTAQGNYIPRQRNLSCLGKQCQSESVTPSENRTIFLTFSKGYPISENELRDYITRIFGYFVETISMQQVELGKQPLCARLVARSQSMVSAVINKDGPDGKYKYYINRKYVFGRKSIKRASSRLLTLVFDWHYLRYVMVDY